MSFDRGDRVIITHSDGSTRPATVRLNDGVWVTVVDEHSITHHVQVHQVAPNPEPSDDVVTTGFWVGYRTRPDGKILHPLYGWGRIDDHGHHVQDDGLPSYLP